MAQDARTQIADLLGRAPQEIVFTSGGSEANNHALKGVSFASGKERPHFITSSAEHSAIVAPLRFVQRLGARVTRRLMAWGWSIPTTCGMRSRPTPCLSPSCTPTTRRERSKGRTRPHGGWVCYHTGIWWFDLEGHEIGVVGCAVGVSLAVLVAEEVIASGCGHLISVGLSGQITPQGAPSYFILIDRAWRDEGTRYQ